MLKFCSHCGKALDETAKFCTKCGAVVQTETPPVQEASTPPQPEAQPQQTYQQQSQSDNQYQQQGYRQQTDYGPNTYQYQQQNYGQQGGYGQNTYQYQQQYQYNYGQQNYYQPPRNIIQELSKKVEIEGIIWTVVAGLQYLLSLIYIIIGLDSYDGEWMIFYALLILAVAILNTFGAIQSFKFSKEVKMRPVGIIDRYEPMGARVANVVYNVLFGGIVGIAGSIYGFFIRNFVITNKMEFWDIQNKFFDEEKKHNNSFTG